MGNAVGNYFSRHRLPPLTTKKEAEASAENRRKFVELLKWAGGSTLFFIAVTKLVTASVQHTDFFRTLSPVKQRRFPTYVTSMLHALVGTAFSLKKLLLDKPEDQSGNRRQLAFTLGYFVQDLIATMPDWIAHPQVGCQPYPPVDHELTMRSLQELLHHVAGITVIVAAMMRRSVTEYIPRFLVVESSTVCLDLMWFLKETGQTSTMMYKITSISFATLFASTRVLWMPYGLMEIAYNNTAKWQGLGWPRFALLPLCGLQFYWFYRIVLMLTR